MGRINFIVCIILIHINFIKAQVQMLPNIQIAHPDGKKITFMLVSAKERLEILKNEVQSVLRVDEFLFKTPIHVLTNGDYLVEYTIRDYAMRFTSKESLDLFTDNKVYYQVSIHGADKLMHYCFWIKSNDRIIQFMKTEPTYIDAYPSKLNYKLFQLKDGAYIRVHKRAENVFDGTWFPNLDDFEYYYNNQLTD
jgi:hypothetical protein